MTTPPKPMSHASASQSHSSSEDKPSAAKKGGGGFKERLEEALAEQAMTVEVKQAVDRFLANMPPDPAAAEKAFYEAMPRADIDPDQQKKLDAIFGHPANDDKQQAGSAVG